jgi:hypothetical protein
MRSISDFGGRGRRCSEGEPDLNLTNS